MSKILNKNTLRMPCNHHKILGASIAEPRTVKCSTCRKRWSVRLVSVSKHAKDITNMELFHAEWSEVL